MTARAEPSGGSATYTLTIPATLTVTQAGWNATDGISATGSLGDEESLVVEASSANEFALVSGENVIRYVLAESGDEATTYEDATEQTTWEFTNLSEDASIQGLGVVVDDYSGAPEGEYTDVITFSASVGSDGSASQLGRALAPLSDDEVSFGMTFGGGSDPVYTLSFEKADGVFTCTGITVDGESVEPKAVTGATWRIEFVEPGYGYGAAAELNDSQFVVWVTDDTGDSAFSGFALFNIDADEFQTSENLTSVTVNGAEVLDVLSPMQGGVG